jgi:hypothetical protein
MQQEQLLPTQVPNF